jgi:hypothetical protein
MSQTVWDITVVGIFQDIDGNMFAATEVVSVSLMGKLHFFTTKQGPREQDKEGFSFKSKIMLVLNRAFL